MGRCLLVANQTLGGVELDRLVRDRLDRGSDHFYVVAPRTRVSNELKTYSGGFGVYEGMSRDQIRVTNERAIRNFEAALDEADRRARHRLDQMIARIREAGGHAAGEVGVDDPLEATGEVLAVQGTFDEIIVSTLPVGLSRWVRRDVPRRIARMARVPVTTVSVGAVLAEPSG